MLHVPDGQERLILATGRYLGEGFDDSRLDTLFLTMPISWKGTLAQYVGRLHREHQGKNEVLVYDYTDSAVPVLARMATRRGAGYRALGYVVTLSPAPSARRPAPVNTMGSGRSQCSRNGKIRSTVHSQRQSTSALGRDQPTDHGRNSVQRPWEYDRHADPALTDRPLAASGRRRDRPARRGAGRPSAAFRPSSTAPGSTRCAARPRSTAS